MNQFGVGFKILALSLALLMSARFARAEVSSPGASVQINGGTFVPFNVPAKATTVAPFSIDTFPVTNKDFMAFVKTHSEWRKSQIKKIFADAHYLQDWPSDLSFGDADAQSPVTRVSWFAATAYCESLNKSLPKTEQWEFALYDNGRHLNELNDKILAWYGTPNQKRIARVATGFKNDFGVYDLGILVWERTEDFNSFLSASDSRSDGKDSNLFCGNGSQMGNPADYAAFMRYSFRSSLKADYTTANLGFRCAYSKNSERRK